MSAGDKRIKCTAMVCIIQLYLLKYFNKRLSVDWLWAMYILHHNSGFTNGTSSFRFVAYLSMYQHRFVDG